MTLFFALLLTYLPFGTFLYDLYQLSDSDVNPRMSSIYIRSIPSDSTALPLPIVTKKGNYKTLKQTIKLRQEAFQKRYKTAKEDVAQSAIIKEAGLYITDQLVNGLFPHWYGTPWAFDGYSAVPNQGTIGCSYFVSTTLLHVGFNVNRYKLAQQGPVSEARSLALNNTPLPIDLMNDIEEFEELINAKCEEGLYFIGLGHSHVGYLFYREGETYFIQSSYGKSGNVVIDYAMESDILVNFFNFTLVPITTNTSLIKHWLKGEEIVVVKGSE